MKNSVKFTSLSKTIIYVGVLWCLFFSIANCVNDDLRDGFNEEGWRLRSTLVVLAADNSPHDFTNVHLEMKDLDEAVRRKRKNDDSNYVQVRFSIIYKKNNDSRDVARVDNLSIQGIDINRAFFLSGFKGARKENLPRNVSDVTGLRDLEYAMEFDLPYGAGKLKISLGKFQGLYNLYSGCPLGLDDIYNETKRFFLDELKDSILANTQSWFNQDKNSKDIDELKQKHHETQQSDLSGDMWQTSRDLWERVHKISNDSERVLLRVLNSDSENKDSSLSKCIHNCFSSLQDAQAIEVVVMHIHSTRDPCDVCAPYLTRALENDTSFVGKLKERLAMHYYQEGRHPNFLLLVSSSKKHKNREGGFHGVDGKWDEKINPMTFPPFFPLYRFSGEKDDDIDQSLYIHPPAVITKSRFLNRMGPFAEAVLQFIGHHQQPQQLASL